MKLTFLDATSRQLVVFCHSLILPRTYGVTSESYADFSMLSGDDAIIKRVHAPKPQLGPPLNKPKLMNLPKGFALSEQIQSGVLCRRSEETEALQTHAVSSVVDLLKAGVSLAKSLHQ